MDNSAAQILIYILILEKRVARAYCKEMAHFTRKSLKFPVIRSLVLFKAF